MSEKCDTLSIFDFDATLIQSPEPEAGKVKYQEETGKPWMIENTATALQYGFDPMFRRTGWWGRVESLMPPLFPRPVPKEFLIETTYQHYLVDKSDADTRMVLLTGRHMRLAPVVKEILSELKIDFPEMYFKGHPDFTRRPGYPRNNDTPDFKLFAISECLVTEEIRHLKIYEDRPDILQMFRTTLLEKLRSKYPNLKSVYINDAVINLGEYYSF